MLYQTQKNTMVYSAKFIPLSSEATEVQSNVFVKFSATDRNFLPEFGRLNHKV